MGNFFMKQQILTGKKIIITGASSGLGESLAWQIAKKGGIPILLARSTEKLQQISTSLYEKFAVLTPFYPVDLSNKAMTKKVMNTIISEHNPIHGLINNAGVGVFSEVNHISEEAISKMFQLNVEALIYVTKQLLPYLLQQEHAHIINIASQAGKVATPKAAIYGATKHAVLGFTNGLRMELASSNIIVTAVNLGPVKTNFFRTADPEGKYEQNVARYILNPDDVAKKVAACLFVRKREINLPLWMDIGSRIYQLLPGLCEHLLRNQFSKK